VKPKPFKSQSAFKKRVLSGPWMDRLIAPGISIAQVSSMMPGRWEDNCGALKKMVESSEREVCSEKIFENFPAKVTSEPSMPRTPVSSFTDLPSSKVPFKAMCNGLSP